MNSDIEFCDYDDFMRWVGATEAGRLAPHIYVQTLCTVVFPDVHVRLPRKECVDKLRDITCTLRYSPTMIKLAHEVLAIIKVEEVLQEIGSYG